MARAVASAVHLVSAASAASCRTPTQVTVELSTDVDCAAFIEASVTAHRATADAAVPSGTTRSCDGSSIPHRIGSIVIVPSASKDAAFGVTAAAAVSLGPLAEGSQATRAEECLVPAASRPANCVVSRRTLRFLPQRDLVLPIVLSAACLQMRTPCADDQTCIDGRCVDPAVDPGELCSGEDCESASASTASTQAHSSSTLAIGGAGGVGGFGVGGLGVGGLGVGGLGAGGLVTTGVGGADVFTSCIIERQGCETAHGERGICVADDCLATTSLRCVAPSAASEAPTHYCGCEPQGAGRLNYWNASAALSFAPHGLFTAGPCALPRSCDGPGKCAGAAKCRLPVAECAIPCGGSCWVLPAVCSKLPVRHPCPAVGSPQPECELIREERAFAEPGTCN